MQGYNSNDKKNSFFDDWDLSESGGTNQVEASSTTFLFPHAFAYFQLILLGIEFWYIKYCCLPLLALA